MVRPAFLILCLGQAIWLASMFYQGEIIESVQRKLDRVDELAAQKPACPAPSGKGEAKLPSAVPQL